MDIQEALENYNIYKARISIIEEKIRELESETIEVKGANLDGMPKAKGFVESGLEKQIIRKQERIEEKRKDIEELTQILRIVENLVKTLKKHNQDIIRMRFYEMMSIEEIAVKKDRSYRAINNTINASVSKMQKKYNEIESFLKIS